MALFMQLDGDERQKKLYLPRKNILDRYDDKELYKRFRFDRAGIEVFVRKIIFVTFLQFITNLVREDIETETKRGLPIPVETQVLAFLHYAAGHTFQLHISDSLGISQGSLSNCVKRVATSLANKADQFIYFPRENREVRKSKAAFFAKGMPGVIGLIDGTHIHVRAPFLAVERDYVNRKGRHSINVQVIVDENGKFINIVASWPGCTHDSFILRHSNVYQAFENRQIDGILLADSGYFNRRWILTPIRNPLTRPQQRLFYTL